MLKEAIDWLCACGVLRQVGERAQGVPAELEPNWRQAQELIEEFVPTQVERVAYFLGRTARDLRSEIDASMTPCASLVCCGLSSDGRSHWWVAVPRDPPIAMSEQQSTYTVEGTVRDPAGQVVAQLEITLHSPVTEPSPKASAVRASMIDRPRSPQ